MIPRLEGGREGMRESEKRRRRWLCAEWRWVGRWRFIQRRAVDCFSREGEMRFHGGQVFKGVDSWMVGDSVLFPFFAVWENGQRVLIVKNWKPALEKKEGWEGRACIKSTFTEMMRWRKASQSQTTFLRKAKDKNGESACQYSRGPPLPIQQIQPWSSRRHRRWSSPLLSTPANTLFSFFFSRTLSCIITLLSTG